MLDQIKKHPVVSAAAGVVAVMGALAVVKGFVTDTWPWMVASTASASTWVADWGPVVVAGLASGMAIYFGLQYSRYRDALRRIVRDYMVDVADLQTRLDPEHFGPMSDGVKRGEESADPTWGAKIIGKYGLPPEREYR